MKQDINYYKFKLQLLTLLMLFVTVFSLGAQSSETLVVGQVFNKLDREPLENVSVYFKGTNNHVLTNEEGYFLIRHRGSESVLIFSQLGFNRVEVKVLPGESAGIEVQLEEKINLLDELIVNPGANPAHDLMKRVVANRKKNRVIARQEANEQHLVLLSKKSTRWENNRLFEEFKKGNISENDTSLLVPLFMEETRYKVTEKERELVSRNNYNTSQTAQNIISDLLGGLNTDVNFYNNSVSVLGKGMVSPLANVGRSYYRYYLTDSTTYEGGKEYHLSFRSKNIKNLAFNGEMRIDSATLALTFIDAGLPRGANLNFIHNLRFNQNFRKKEHVWIAQNEYSAWDMTYELLKGEDGKIPELLIHKKTEFAATNLDFKLEIDSFANSPYSRQLLEERMTAVQTSPLYKTASYIADAILSGYLRVGFIDIGQYVDLMRLTEIEGLRAGVPLRTNERLLKNMMFGGHAMYGFRDKAWKYSAEAQWKLPVKNRLILGGKLLHDYRRIDYDYNDFFWRENPLATGDENIVSTLFALRERHRMSFREETSAFLLYDWTPNIETNLSFRQVNYLANDLLPFIQNGVSYENLLSRHLSLTGRFSWGQHKNDRHFQRLYVKSPKPVIYLTAEGGDYHFGDNRDYYARLSGSFLHKGQSYLGDWRYMLEGGKVLGAVPYPLLKFIQGKDGASYNRYEFALMNNREYIADTYLNLFTEYIFNGVLFNRIPLIKHLNLREIVSLKASYGTLNDRHAALMDIPRPSEKFSYPYSEVSAGFTNLLGLISVQSIWRLTDLDKPGVKRWGVRASIIVTF